MKKLIIALCIMFFLLSFNLFASWEQSSNGISTNSNVKVLVSTNNRIFAAAGGIYYSTNNGGNWINCAIINFTSLTASGNDISAAAGNEIYHSPDLGATWSVIRTNISTIFALTYSGNALLAGEDSYALLRTTNNGASWTYPNISNVRVLGSNGSHVFARNSGGVYLSTDNGVSFSQVSFPGSYPLCFAADGNNVYAGTINTGVLHSSDNGVTWVSAGMGINNVQSIAVTGSSVFAGTPASGVYLTTNSGLTWNQINDGLTDLNIKSLLIYGNFIFAGTGSASVWKRNLSEVLSIQLISSEIPEHFSLEQNYPNPFNPRTVISFQLAVNNFVTIKIYDVIGIEIATLVNEQLQPRIYEVKWDASNYPSGVYYYQLNAGIYSETKKMVLVK